MCASICQHCWLSKKRCKHPCAFQKQQGNATHAVKGIWDLNWRRLALNHLFRTSKMSRFYNSNNLVKQSVQHGHSEPKDKLDQVTKGRTNWPNSKWKASHHDFTSLCFLTGPSLNSRNLRGTKNFNFWKLPETCVASSTFLKVGWFSMPGPLWLACSSTGCLPGAALEW